MNDVGVAVAAADHGCFRYLQHMDDVHARLQSLGMDQESAKGILDRYKEIGLPNWLVVDSGAST